LFVCDDASTDGSQKLIAEYAKRDPRIRHLRFQPQVGLPARLIANAAKQASGEFYAFVFDDTELNSRCLETLATALQVDPAVALAYGKAVMHFPDGQTVALGKPFNTYAIRQGNIIPNVSAMVRKSTLDQVGLYDPHVILKTRCDWDLWIRISKRFHVMFIDDEVAVEYGPSRPDSIGNTCTYIPEIASKYMRCDRDSLLRPQSIESYNSFSVNPFGIYAPEEQDQVRFLVLEHFVKTTNLQALESLERSVGDLLSQLRVNNPCFVDESISKGISHLINYYEEKLLMLRQDKIKWETIAAEANLQLSHCISPSPIGNGVLYRVVPDRGGWAGLDVLIGTHHRSADGKLILQVFSNNNLQVREVSADLSEIGDNEWLALRFEPISDSNSIPFIVSFHLEEVHSPISLYELKPEGKLDRLRRLLGMRFVRDTLYAKMVY
jgi:glycosyltransferase involved in cell wall biosynthesis